MLIDDDQDDQEIFSMALEDINSDIQCVMASNGIAALEKLKAKKPLIPDYIFIDMNMPRMNGMECLQEIQKLDHLKDADVFMYSTSSDETMIEKSKALGAKDFIVKPPGLALLTEKLMQVFKMQAGR
ncbi:Response regulator receiver domain-containing protein [Chryseolinea serpens]|uniref:Response regulator receiver domain-containing protein n=1 Tax=Chryseolinea serpens TaxID=947013 RepID=A0A1M5RDK1_9BACT|nr:Response regulator receiver domain-containing protein [Chryseolinea serpens]